MNKTNGMAIANIVGNGMIILGTLITAYVISKVSGKSIFESFMMVQSNKR